ncbi:MAG: hypothetical protein L0338_38930, partial [Acidobacteria bacterium]|nr:hypothetical protein [Acidobacteriota bacterium]
AQPRQRDRRAAARRCDGVALGMTAGTIGNARRGATGLRFLCPDTERDGARSLRMFITVPVFKRQTALTTQLQ